MEVSEQMMDWGAWLAERPAPALAALAKRINADLPDAHALLSREPWGDHTVWVVQAGRQAFITTWEEAERFAGVAVQGMLFGEGGETL